MRSSPASAPRPRSAASRRRHRALRAESYEEIREHIGSATVGVVGPGLGRHPSTWRLVHLLLDGIDLPLVVDADGPNALAEDQELLACLGTGGRVRVLTHIPARWRG